MKKETYYFSHDYNAIQDPKMMSLLFNCGLSGIGMYWILIELLHQQPNNEMDYQDYCNFIDFYGISDGENEQLLSNIKDKLIEIGLFIKKDNTIYSNRVLENTKKMEEYKKGKSEAGKKGMEKRWNTSEKDNSDITENNSDITKHNKIKENKRKEKKINENKLNNIEIEQQVATPSQIADSFLNDIDSKYRKIFLEDLEGKGYDVEITKEEMLKFIDYWTEPTKSGKKQRWETQKTFEIKRRLRTWFNNIKSFNNNKSNLTSI